MCFSIIISKSFCFTVYHITQSDHHILNFEFDFAQPSHYRSRDTSRETASEKRQSISDLLVRCTELHVTSSYRNVWLSVAKSATSPFWELDICNPPLFLPPDVFSNIAFKRLNHASLPSTWRTLIAKLFLLLCLYYDRCNPYVNGRSIISSCNNLYK